MTSNKQKLRTIVTHDKSFHADEVIAVALFEMVYAGLNIIRTRDKDELAYHLSKLNHVVVDVGGVYDAKIHNFDHHQDMNLPSSAGLAWQHLKGHFSKDTHEYLDNFFLVIDAIDTNRNDIYEKFNTLPKGWRDVSAIIGAFNRDPNDDHLQMVQFRKAISFAQIILENELYAAKQYAQSAEAYENREVLRNNVTILRGMPTVRVYQQIWRDKKEHTFAIVPHANGFSVETSDSKNFPLPIIDDPNKSTYPSFVFQHQGRFMVVFRLYDDALRYALTI